MRRSNTILTPGRVFAVLLALGAHLLAAGGPLLHAAAHEAHEALASHHAHDTHADAPAPEPETPASHDHGGIHPAALHDAAPSLRADAPVFALAVAEPEIQVVSLEPAVPAVVRPVPRLSSRAPPPGDPARAPPA